MDDKKNFFISCNKQHRALAEWAACQLEMLGYTTLAQAIEVEGVRPPPESGSAAQCPPALPRLPGSPMLASKTVLMPKGASR